MEVFLCEITDKFGLHVLETSHQNWRTIPTANNALNLREEKTYFLKEPNINQFWIIHEKRSWEHA